MENILGNLRNNDARVDWKVIDALLAANDELKHMLEDISDSDNVDITACITNLDNLGACNQVEAAKIEKTETYEKLRRDLSKRGRFLYMLVRSSDSKELDQQRIYINLSNSIQSIGNIIISFIREANGNNRDQGSSDQEMLFLFSTVLDQELTTIALGADITEVVQLDIVSQEALIIQLLLEAEQSELTPRNESLVEKVDDTKEALGEKQKTEGNDEERIRVNVTLLNELVNLATEMVLARNQLLRVLENHTEIPEIKPILQNISHTTMNMQEKIMRTRMQPLSYLFRSLPRTVRELAKSMGKSINLSIEGKSVELDRSIIEGLADPLTHLVRNALDHGIETADVRKRLGKDRTANLMIKAYQGGRVVIDIIDDGCGLDLEKLKLQALRQGVINNHQANAILEQELINLIFLPGFSTNDQVTAISGRGVGLDVVRTNIEKLGGTVEVFTAKNKGTTFRLILPLTLAIIPSLIISIADHYFALPQVNIEEIVRIVPGDDLRKMENIQGCWILRLRGKLIPVVQLAEIVGLQPDHAKSSSIMRVLVVKNAMRTFALIVDAIHEREEILVKPLPSYLKERKVYSGVSIMGDGKIAMILDANGIASVAKLLQAEEQIENYSLENLTVNNQPLEMQELLLFQCAGPETFGLNLSVISRIDQINPNQIEIIGNKEYIKCNGRILQLIRPEKYLPVTNTYDDVQKMYIIIPKTLEHPLAILVGTIKDTVQTHLDINKDDISATGLLGSVILNNKIVLVLNLEELFAMAASEHYSVSAINQEERDQHDR